MPLEAFGERWSGVVVAVLGGGPGLAPRQVETCRGAGAFTVAVNDSIIIAPTSEMLYIGDAQWFRWHPDLVLKYVLERSGPVVTLENQELRKKIPGLISLRNDGTSGLCNVPGAVKTGHNGGYAVINLLIQLGVKRIILLGFNLQKVDGQAHWFGDHPVTTTDEALARSLEQFHAAREDFSRSGTEILNCTPNSALNSFRKMSIEEALSQP